MNPELTESVPRDCFACGKRLEADESPGRWYTDYQYDNALWIRFGGGYGMFVESVDFGGPEDVVICHECAHELCATVPWLDRLLGPQHSHSHKAGSVPRGHVGWEFGNCCDEHGDPGDPGRHVYSDD